MNYSSKKLLMNALNDCVTACNYCTSACLGEPDISMLANCIRLNMDCAAICTTTAGFVGKDSAHARPLLPECMELCLKCAEECEKHGYMEHCKLCAAACRECVAICGEMELA